MEGQDQRYTDPGRRMYGETSTSEDKVALISLRAVNKDRWVSKSMIYRLTFSLVGYCCCSIPLTALFIANLRSNVGGYLNFEIAHVQGALVGSLLLFCLNCLSVSFMKSHYKAWLDSRAIGLSKTTLVFQQLSCFHHCRRMPLLGLLVCGKC